LSNLLAAVGRGQLAVLDEHVRRRRENFAHYHQLLAGLPGIGFMPEIPGGFSTRWLSVITIDPQQLGRDRESVRLALEAEQIESRPAWKPMHLQPVFRGCRARGGAVSETIFERGLCLPSGSALTANERIRVADIVIGKS
jgi:pyridoxal phosphate-dependent aminotransferase EpsN